MDYIRSYSQMNEELKRKLSPSALKKQKEDEELERLEKRPADLFSEEEIKILKGDDFEIDPNEKEAKNVERLATFTIKKSFDLNDEVLYTLTIKDNRSGEVIYERKIKVTKRNQHKDTLDFMLDKCAYIIDNMRDKAMKGIDPYGEEEWDEEEKNRILGIEPEKPNPVEKPKEKKKKKEKETTFDEWLYDMDDYHLGRGKKAEYRWGDAGAQLAPKKIEIPIGDEQLPDEDEEIFPDEDEQLRIERLIQNQEEAVIQKLEKEFAYEELLDSSYEAVKDIIDDIKAEMEEDNWYKEEQKELTQVGDYMFTKHKNPNPVKYKECIYCGGTGRGGFGPCSACNGTGYLEKSKDKQKNERRTENMKFLNSLSSKEYFELVPPGLGELENDRIKELCEMDPDELKNLLLDKMGSKKKAKKKSAIKSSEEHWKEWEDAYVKSAKKFKEMSEEQKPKKNAPKYKETECHWCKGWGRDEYGKLCDSCGGSGKIKVSADYKGPTWSIGGASDYSYGS